MSRTKSFTKSLNMFLYRAFLICLGLIGLFLIVVVKSQSSFENFYATPLFIYTIAITSFQLSRLIGAMLYKKSKKTILSPDNCQVKPGSYEPSVSFVIPCLNEEKVIGKTVRKCFEADYPKEKIEVIVVNDGSTDGTLDVLTKL